MVRAQLGWWLGLVAWLCSAWWTTSVARAAEPDPERSAEQAPAGTPVAPLAPLAELLTGPAKVEYEAGKLLFESGQHAEAAAKFGRAHELSSDPRLLWNIAACEQKLAHYSRMLGLLRRYLAESATALSDEERAEVTAIVAVTSKLVTPLRVLSHPDGAEVWVDGQQVGVTPLAPGTTIDAGGRTIEVRKAHFETQQHRVAVVGGKPVVLDVTLQARIEHGHIEVVAGAGDAIEVDGQLVGTGSWRGLVRTGGHKVRVTNEGKVPERRQVTVEAGQTSRLKLELADQPTPTTTILLASGAVTVAVVGVVVAVVALQARDDEVTGTIPPGSVPLAAPIWPALAW